ncbi:predicted protein [Sclerotinia sclerotiorum 1980 UF-70]|uniref:Uncharacterized protein n=2 Tax=Sclerotinia sclerotiorum (strain ATCC 18683 / 1980 / Ss-1) TaxID=665079 RepID=A7F4I6_SCLS1|nr:predicted protein [Sclerotinia sclerotiorum 1980 UF-70]APA10646.1 hypothetical protein sscle_06g054160 [Sclerotinia sclerotiorum 1980 UF-70]EDN97657.1 predicted protein [Sclerotinia sclerotiorum 1980 UF-70]
MSDFANLLQDLVRVSDNQEVRHETWGFTIYRTAYTGSQDDQRWDILIDAITSSVYNVIMTSPEGTSGSNNEEAQLLWSLFDLDLKVNSTLKDLDMDDLRKTHQEGGSQNGRGCFLLVDQEVLTDVDGKGDYWIKCVQADYKASDYVPRNSRVTQRYFGWLKVKIKKTFELWEKLVMFGELERIAPPTIGGVQVIWDGDSSM